MNAYIATILAQIPDSVALSLSIHCQHALVAQPSCPIPSTVNRQILPMVPFHMTITLYHFRFIFLFYTGTSSIRCLRSFDAGIIKVFLYYTVLHAILCPGGILVTIFVKKWEIISLKINSYIHS